MDTIAKRSALISTALHATVVITALWPGGCATFPTSPTLASTQTAPTPQAAKPPREAAAQRGAQVPPVHAQQKPDLAPLRLVLAPQPAPGPMSPLPPLVPSDPSGTWTRPITPANSDHQGAQVSAGAGGGAESAHIRAPQLSAQGTDLIGQLRVHRTSNLDLDRIQRNLRTTQEFLEDLLDLQIHRRWYVLASRRTQNRVVIEAQVDARGRVTAQLLTSTGAPEFDAVISSWLATGDLALPPIPPGVRYSFLVVIR